MNIKNNQKLSINNCTTLSACNKNIDNRVERISKRLARAGIASRREAEVIIASGRVSVNGIILKSPVFNVKKTDIVKIDNKVIISEQKTRLWIYNKPSGLITTKRDPEGRTTIFETLPKDIPPVISIGRLDINTEGLLLLTNNGDLSRILEIPATGWIRKYRVRVYGKTTQKKLDSLKNGIVIDGFFYGSIKAIIERRLGDNIWISISLHEGKNREIKKIMQALGLQVSRIIRISFGPFELENLSPGKIFEVHTYDLLHKIGLKLLNMANVNTNYFFSHK